MESRKLQYFSLMAVLVIVTAFTACDTAQIGMDEFGQGAIVMKVNSESSSSKTQSSFTSQGNIAINDGTNEIEILEVKFFLEELELDGADGHPDFELEDLNDFIVNLPLDGSPLVISQAEIPVGFYDEFEMEIAKPDSDVDVTDFDFRDETGNYSVVVKGLFNGEEFTFRSSEDFEIDVDLDPPLEISETSQSTLVININVAIWFVGDDGLVLHPKELNNLEKINDNIEKSFEAFEDSFDD
jgi:hypothetical protein